MPVKQNPLDLCRVGTVFGGIYFFIYRVLDGIFLCVFGAFFSGVLCTAGFKTKGNNTPSARNTGTCKLFDAKTAYARFVPTGATDSITVLSDGNPMLGFLNFDQYDHVTVAYWSDANPQAATIISWRSYPIFLFCGFLGVVLLLMGDKK